MQQCAECESNDSSLHQIPKLLEGLSEGLEIQEEAPRLEPDAAVKGSAEIQWEIHLCT